jgi:DNA-binding NarL/FixJ family response regulator
MLGLSVNTVANTLARIYRKTGAASRAGLGTTLAAAISAQGDHAVRSSK